MMNGLLLYKYAFWHEDVADMILEDFEKFRKMYTRLFENKTENHIEGIKWGYVAEAMVQKELGRHIHKPTDGPDLGWDYDYYPNPIIESGPVRVDVKCKLIHDLIYMRNSWWSVSNYYGLRADKYAFYVICPEEKQLYYIGELEAFWIRKNCAHVRKGDLIPGTPRTISTSDCYIITMDDIFRRDDELEGNDDLYRENRYLSQAIYNPENWGYDTDRHPVPMHLRMQKLYELADEGPDRPQYKPKQNSAAAAIMNDALRSK